MNGRLLSLLVLAGVAPTLVSCASGLRTQPGLPVTDYTKQADAQRVGPFDSRRSRFVGTYPTGKTLLFASSGAGSSVNVYVAGLLRKNPSPIAVITDAVSGPQGLAMDMNGTLYVANNSCCNYSVTEYPKGQTIHSLTITNGIYSPFGLTTDSKGTLYVANQGAGSCSPCPNIAEYPLGSTSPTRVIMSKLFQGINGVTEYKGSLYISDGNAKQVLRIRNGSTSVTSLNLQGLTQPWGVAFDKGGNLWVTDISGFVNIYAPGSRTAKKTLTLGLSAPLGVYASATGQMVIANWTKNGPIYEYAPGHYKPEATLSNGVSYPDYLIMKLP